MKRNVAFLAAFGLVALLVSAFMRAPEAQTEGARAPQNLNLEFCQISGQTIEASEMPQSFDMGRCEFDDFTVTDNGVGAALPPRGQGVAVEALRRDGVQDLKLIHRRDGTVELEGVGDEVAAIQAEMDEAEAGRAVASRAANECRVRAFDNAGWRVQGTLPYQINVASRPSELSRRATIVAIKRGGTNITNTRNRCGIGDKVPARLAYRGTTGTQADVSSRATCTNSDNRSVASFGALPKGIVGVACSYFLPERGLDSIANADIKFNKARANFTTNPERRCRNKFDLESVATHERGHTFGLGHVSEGRAGRLTMSPLIDGPCQANERTLGRGDVIGLASKY